LSQAAKPLSELVTSESLSSPVLLLVDGHSLAFRSYFAHTKGRDGGLRTSTGIPTSVSYGFLKALLDTLTQEKPTYTAIAFDCDAPTFRHEADDSYKEGRPEAPEDFLPDVLNLQELLTALNLPIFAVPGYEADDVIGTLARRATEQQLRVKILTGDRDLFQLVDRDLGISVLYLGSTVARRGSTDPREFGPEEVQAKMGIAPTQVVDYKALCGDSSDNIPGVKGIGDKTAVQLLSTYGSLAEIYAALDELKPAIRKKLEAGREDALRSQYLAQIHLDVPLEANLSTCKLAGFSTEAVMPLLEKLEFKSFLGKLQKLQEQFGGQSIAQDAEASLAASDPSALEPIAGGEDLWFFSSADTAAAQSLDLPELQVNVIDTVEKLTLLVDYLTRCADSKLPVAWDTETTDLDPWRATLVGIGCCFPLVLAAEPSAALPFAITPLHPTTAKALDLAEPEQLPSLVVAYIPLHHRAGETLPLAQVRAALEPILANDRYPKVLQNAKFDRLILRVQEMDLAGVIFDTMLASYLLEPESSHKLSDLGHRYLQMQAQDYSDLVPRGKTIADLPILDVAQYCGMDVYTTFNLVPLLRQDLAEVPAIQELLLTVEQPLEPVLAEMEYQGIRIDRNYLQTFSQQLERDLAQIEQQAHASAGEEFNLGSPKQLSELLFDRLNLSRKKSRKTKTGYSTDASTLEKLQGDHPVIDLILQHRSLSKLKSTYVDALPALVHPKTDRIHTDFNQAVTATGRLSSSNPNLQNIPIRTEFSRQIRQAFVPEPGWLLVSADYSQIELRILTHLSQEPVLLEAYRNNDDVHRLTAKMLFDREEITSEERRLGKVINFGVIYGMGAQRFAREADVPIAEAKGFIERFNDRYAQVFEYLQRMQQLAIAQGYVETILGRRRYFNFGSDTLKALRGSDPEAIDLSNIRTRDQYDAQLLRAAANAPIQGSSADIIKVAMVKIHNLLRAYQTRLLLQVHDELVFEAPPDEWAELEPQIKATMESAVTLSVPLVVEIHAGQNWMEAK